MDSGFESRFDAESLKKKKGTSGSAFDGNLLAWAHRRVMEAGQSLRPLVARARGSEVDVFDVVDLIGSGAPETVTAVAAIVARSAGDDDLVAVLSPANNLGARDPKKVLWTAMLASRSRSGRFAVSIWEARRSSDGALITRTDSLEKQLAALADWMHPSTFVDPEIDDILASAGVEGAIRRLKPAAVMAVPSSAKPAAPLAIAYTPEQLGDALYVPWETADVLMTEVNDGSPGELLGARFMHVPAGAPVGLATRSFRDLVRSGWSTDAQAVLVSKKLERDSDLLDALPAILESEMPFPAVVSGVGRIAFWALMREDHGLAAAAADALIERIDRSIDEAGGQRAWLAGVWPAPGTRLTDFLGTVLLGAAADAAVWSLTVAIYRKTPTDAAIIRMETLRDDVLDQLEIPAGVPGDRVVAAQQRVFRLLPSPSGERRIDVWRARLADTSRLGSVDDTMRDYATYYATWLHSVATLAKASRARRAAMLSKTYDDWRPDCVPIAGTLSRVWTVLARHCLLRAIVEVEWEARIAFLLRARELAVGDDRYAWIVNEARCWALEFDAELLGDLLEENRRAPSLGAAADLLRAAERLGDRSAIAKAQKRLRSLARGTGYEWIAEARITLARPIERADRFRISKLLEGAPFGEIDPESRAVRALYGNSHEARIQEVREALRRQAEALDWAALVEEVRVEERRAPKRAPVEDTLDEETSRWHSQFFFRHDAVWPTLRPYDYEARREMRVVADAASAAKTPEERAEVDRRLTELLSSAVARQAAEEVEDDAEDDGFAFMTIGDDALEWSRRELATPEWALAEACRQVTFFNLARGRRDLKMLRGTRDDRGALWELRHRDGRHPVRVMYVYRDRGPEVVAVLAKQDDAHQSRMIERVRARVQPR